MGAPKISIALLVCLIALAMPYPSYAQNSPQDFQDAHNVARAQVGVGGLTWSSTLATSAQGYANQRIHECNGENGIAGNWASGNDPFNALDAVELWLSGWADYDYNSNSCKEGSVALCLAFINMVWRGSTTFGCARVPCRENNRWLIFCYYDPPSNFPDNRPY